MLSSSNRKKRKSSRNTKRKSRVSIVHFNEGEITRIGKYGSLINRILTGSTLNSRNSCMMGYSVFKPGTTSTQRIHPKSEEYVYVVSGSGKIAVGNEILSYGPGDSLFIPAGAPHGVLNEGDEAIVMVFFFSSPNYPKTVNAQV